MSKKRIFRVMITAIVLLLLLTAGAALLLTPKKARAHPDFSSMPTDTAGYNMIGNLPENLSAGGFMAGQNGWIYFTNFSDGGSLYMCRENGADMVKVTDFPVCNINVLGPSVVFTRFERFASEIGGVQAAAADDVRLASSNQDRLYPAFSSDTIRDSAPGGKLYAIYGMHSASGPRFCVIDPDAMYFSPYLDLDGLYAVCVDETQSVLANKTSGSRMIITRDGESVKKIFSYGDTIYANLSGTSDKNSRIMRIDAQTLFPLDYINGSGLYRIGSSFVFRGADGFVYELMPASGTVKPISAVPVDPFTVNAFGEIITAPLGNSAGFLVITTQRRYGNIAEAVLPRLSSEAVTMQNGWYSYKRLSAQHDSKSWFQANGNYYSLDGTAWSAKWLSTKLDTSPLVSVDDLIVEDLFTPTWLDFSADMEPIDPADGGDFGSERPVRPDADSRADAASDARRALDATVLLLLEDGRIADEYTGESVEKLRSWYADAFDTALEGAAGSLSSVLANRLGISVSEQEAHEILVVWLQSASYETGGIQASSNGTEAGVTFTVKNPVDVNLVCGMLEAADDADTAYAEIVREPEQYGLMSSVPESAQIYMSMASADCWVAESPDKLIRVFVRGLD